MSDNHDNDDPENEKPKRKPRKRPSPRAGAPYEVGKGKPPKASQFKKGGKGGPGRPRGSTNPADLGKLLDERVIVGEDSLGRPRRKTVRRVIDTTLAKLAMKGDIGAIKVVKDYELRLEAIKARGGNGLLSVEEAMKIAREDEEKKRLQQKLTANILHYMEQQATLKRLGLVEGKDMTFSPKMLRIIAELPAESSDGDDGPD